MTKKNFFSKSVYGHSFTRIPLELFQAGSGRTSIVFVSSFGADPPCTTLLRRYMEDLSFSSNTEVEKVNLPFLLSLRTLFFIPAPNPDGLFIKSGEFSAAHPLHERILRIASDSPLAHWQSNGRGVEPGRNFNFGFSSYKKTALPLPAPAGFCGDYPESEPESASFAELMRKTNPRLLVHIEKGNGFSLPNHRLRPFLSELCAANGSLPFESQDFSCTPEGWIAEERETPALRIGIPEDRLSDTQIERTYALLRPLLFGLLTF